MHWLSSSDGMIVTPTLLNSTPLYSVASRVPTLLNSYSPSRHFYHSCMQFSIEKIACFSVVHPNFVPSLSSSLSSHFSFFYFHSSFQAAVLLKDLRVDILGPPNEIGKMVRTYVRYCSAYTHICTVSSMSEFDVLKGLVSRDKIKGRKKFIQGASDIRLNGLVVVNSNYKVDISMTLLVP